MTSPKLKVFKRVCKRCGKVYETSHRNSHICDNCKLKGGKNGRRR